MYETKTEDADKDFSNDKKCSIFVIIQLSQTFMIIQTSYCFVGWNMKKLLFQLKNLLDWSQICIHFWQKAKDVNRNVKYEKITHNEYKDVLLNQKCSRHLMNRIQTKNHRIGTYEIDKMYLSCFDDNIYI